MSDVMVLGGFANSFSWSSAIFKRESREEPQVRKPQTGNSWLSASDVAQLIITGEFLDAGVAPPKRFAAPAMESALNSVQRWTSEGRIFAIHDLYPRFQFDAHGRPHAPVERAMQRLGTDDVLRVGNWFAMPNSYLHGRRPQDLLATAPDEVLRALQYA